ncbi:putative protein phosphatase 2C 33 [Acorus gramineus]|uniref:protein-serine/threonine phosphatase n=1 Tax=Acorus gramineus TaxID=55184 RepID=A0AAV9BUE7_ACOGR|nr:putative protein phosphatase 2C 33 [Acorus gramineus]
MNQTAPPRDSGMTGPLPLVPLARPHRAGDPERESVVRHGHAALAKRGEDLFLVKTDCQRIPGNPSCSPFSVFATFDGHNGVSAAVFTRENLLEHVMSAIPQGIGKKEWLQALPRALVAGFVKTDIDFQRKGTDLGVIGMRRMRFWDGEVSLLTVDHRLEENEEERQRVTASGGEVGRLNLCGGQEVRMWWAISTV